MAFEVFHAGAIGEPHPPIENFVSIRIPRDLVETKLDLDFGKPLDAFLKMEGLGKIIGKGSQRSVDIEGHQAKREVGLALDLADLGRGLTALKIELVRLKIPRGTAIQYKRDGLIASEPVYDEGAG